MSFSLQLPLLWLTATGLCWSATEHSGLSAPETALRSGVESRVAPGEVPTWLIETPDWAEPVPPPPPARAQASAPRSLGVFGPSARQPEGALSGRIVFMNSGHGWIYAPDYWRLQRPSPLLEMNEDYGNLDQLNFFADYCFNAGAVVVSMRPLGHQTNEVVLDNDDAGVTFSGAWANSSSSVFYGSAGDVPYRYAAFDVTETATATYTPTIPAEGYYPVYTWVQHGSDRGDQLYRIRHTGGETQVRIPHDMVGNGWVYLGEYYFDAGSNAATGSVIISNLRSTSRGTVVIADAIRFGNGMGSVDRGGGVSGYPREDESMRYWVQAGLGHGQSSSLYDGGSDDEHDSWSAPPKMSAEMNREQEGNIYKRIHISFHSNAASGTARGTMALITGDPTPNQADLAQIVGGEVNSELVSLGSPPLELPWYNRTVNTYSGSYSEISGSLFNDEMAATIIEVAFHDNASDAKLLRSCTARAAVAKAALNGVIKFFHQFDTSDPAPLVFLPEAPVDVRATAVAGGAITLAWAAPAAAVGCDAPTNYIVYRSTNGYGFGNPMSVGNVLTCTLSNLPVNQDYYFRIAASNEGGESMPSKVVGCRISSNPVLPRALFVNDFDRFDRTLNLRQDTVSQHYTPPGPTGGIERVFPRWINSFDYVVQHGKALAAAGWAFDSCEGGAVADGEVLLANYPVVIWECGNNSTNNRTFELFEESRVAGFLNSGGAVLVSGADIALDLDRPSGPTSTDRNFLHNYLHVSYVNDNSGSYTAVPVGGGIFSGESSATVDNGTHGIYWVKAPDTVAPYGSGATVALNYSGGTGGAAAVQYDGSAGRGRAVFMGFPFETITSASRRAQYMSDILAFLDPGATTNAPLKFETIQVLPDGGVRLSLSGDPGSYVIERSMTLTNWSPWTNITIGDVPVEFQDEPTGSQQRFYRAYQSP